MTKSKNRQFAELARSTKLAELKDANIPAGLTISTYGASLIDDAHATAARTTLGSAIGTDVQAHSSVLDSTTAAFTTALNTKLAGIEASATADQTAAEIRTLVESATDSNVFTDADHTKLNGIAASADVTSITVSDGTNSTARTAGSTITFAATSNETTVAESSGTVTIGLPSDVTVSNDLTVSGNLVVSGSTTQTGAIITDNNFTGLTNANTGNATDFGFYGKYVESSTTKYAGLYYDASTDNTFNLFCDTQTVPSSTVNTSATGYAAANLSINNLVAGGTLTTSAGATFGGNIEIDTGSSAMLDFGDITSAYGRLYADNSGTYVGSKSNHDLILRTNNVERFRINTSGNITVTGTIDGRDVAADGTKLDGIATGATNVSNTNQLTNGAGFLTAHPNISAASSSNNSGNTFIQDITLDSNGHITGLATATASAGGSGAGNIDAVTGQYGSVSVDNGSSHDANYAGYAIRDDWVFMSNGASFCGIYNDTNNEWSAIFKQNAEVDLYYNGVAKFETTSSGVHIAGNVSQTGETISDSGRVKWDSTNAQSSGGFIGRHGSNSGGLATDSYPGAIYSIGYNYLPSGTGLSNHYGIGYSHTNASFYGLSGQSGWGMYVAADGDARVQLSGSSGTISCTSNITAYASDQRLKTNIEPIPNALDKIKSLRGVSYDWIDNITSEYDFHPTKMHELGVIAQEVQAVAPELVMEAPFNSLYTQKTGWSKIQAEMEKELGREVKKAEAKEKFEAMSLEEREALQEDHQFLTVDYERLSAILIEAIKEQQSTIENLTARLDKLEKV